MVPTTVLIAASRLHPGRDGGYTVAAMQRARDLLDHTDLEVEILTFDPARSYDEHLAGFRDIGLADERTIMRNLFVETPGVTLPYVERVDWWRASAPVEIARADGSVERLDGFGALYRRWMRDVVAEHRAAGRRVVVLAESKQVGELLVAADSTTRAEDARDYAVVQALTSAHTLAPHTPDAPMDVPWSGWFDVVDRFDAVLWLTERQRSDAAQRFGDHAGWHVLPHPARPPGTVPPPETRDPLAAAMIARLVPVKRVEHAIDAWPRVLELVPDARLTVYGDGPLRAALQGRIDELGLGGAVTLAGHDPRASERIASAAVALMTSEYEGQSLAVLEALAAGTVPVAYDIRYGPDEMIEPGRTGTLVPDGDVTALAEAMAELLADRERRSRMARAARVWAFDHLPAASAERLAGILAPLAR